MRSGRPSLESEDFHAQLKAAIKVSDKNRVLKRKLEARNELFDSFVETDHVDEEFRQSYVPSRTGSTIDLLPVGTSIRLEPGTCFLWFMVKNQTIRDVVSDYELHHCKQVFVRTLQKDKTCHEAHFGLGKLLAHSWQLEDALAHMKEASRLQLHD